MGQDSISLLHCFHPPQGLAETINRGFPDIPLASCSVQFKRLLTYEADMNNWNRIFSTILLLGFFFISTQINAEAFPASSGNEAREALPVAGQQGGNADLVPGYFRASPDADANIGDWGVLAWALLGGAGAGSLLYWLFFRRRSVAAAMSIKAPRPVSPASHSRKTPDHTKAETGSGEDQLSGYWTPLDQTTTVTVEEMESVEEEAEVFLLLGRIDMAIGVLRHHIESSDDATPHVWMALLDVLHGQGLRGEFEKLAAEIKTNFNVALPTWEGANERSSELSGLEHLPHLLAKIISHWQDPSCPDYLHSLIQDDRKGERAGFHQEAFRELLLLISILEFRAKLAA